MDLLNLRRAWVLGIAGLVVSFGCCCWCEGCLDEEREALLQIKHDINYPNGSSLSSWKGNDCCKWYGVLCNNHTSRVNGIRLAQEREVDLGIWYPNATLFAQFKELSSLVLRHNQIGGWRMPRDLCRLNNLQALDLEFNNLTSNDLPSCLGDLTKLESLSLAKNDLIRADFGISKDLCWLINLQALDIGYNNLRSNDLPSCLGNLTNLESLSLAGNDLARGDFEILKVLCRLTNLQSLDLGYNNLEDHNLPSCLGNLTSLESMNLEANNLRGDFGISTGFNRLRNLNELYLSSNRITDEGISPWIGNLTSLSSISLGYNNLKNSLLLTDFCQLRKLKDLTLVYNNIVGSIHRCIGNMPSLEYLNLAVNRLQGSIPPLDNLTSLVAIFFTKNDLDGVATFSTFANLSKLEAIYLSDNPRLEVETESSTWVPSFQLEELVLSNCQLNQHSSHRIPRFLATQYKLEVLDLSNGNLVDKIPSWLIYNLTRLEFLMLSGNSLGGSFPRPSQHNNSSINWLDISENDVLFPFYFDMSMLLPRLLYLNMSGNALRGSIPLHASNTLVLQVLDLSNNEFSGKIPGELLANSGSLRYLSLSNNIFHGDMLPRIYNMSILEHLQLDGNGFIGTISHGLSNSTGLQTLDVRRNLLSGTIPSWLSTLSELSSLLVGENNFVGNVPMELCQMQNLHLLDMSKNRFWGNLPSCFNNISSWKTEFFVNNDVYTTGFNYKELSLRSEFTTKGNSYTYEGVPLSLMTGIDFSLNRLTGNIPSEMGYLKALHSMNLSHNFLTGPFPESFKNLEKIESLDLSYNKLTGEIPRQITQLTTLATFNVSFNNLSGALPDLKNQFSTFNESNYAGNPGLCGEPLKRRCSSDIPSQPKGGRIEEEEEESGIIDNPVFFYSCVAMAHALAFWIFIGLLVFNKGWRFKFFRTVDRYIWVRVIRISELLG